MNFEKQVFEWRSYKKSLKSEVGGNVKFRQQMCKQITQIYEKWTLELNKKRCLKTYPHKSKNVQKMTPKSVQETEFIFGVAAPGAPLVAQTGC